MDVTQFKAGRAFTDALSVVGKPSAMRGTTWDFIDYVYAYLGGLP